MLSIASWKKGVAGVLVAWLAWGTPCHASDAGSEFGECCISPTLDLLKKQDFPGLEARYRDWIGGETLSDGRWKLSGMLFAFSDYYKGPDMESRLEEIRRWRQAFPASALAPVAEATYWNNYAWAARGNTFADKVPEDAWPVFKSRLLTSRRVLDDAREVASGNPLWYRIYLLDLMGLDAGPAARLQVFLAGIDRFPGYYALYEVMGYTMVPKWGGSTDALETFARLVGHGKPADEQAVIYAQIYRIVGQQGMARENIFKASQASWSTMKDGFEVLAIRHGRDAFNLNSYALFACEAGDRRTFRTLYEELQGRLIPSIWPEVFSPAYCDRILKEPPPPPRTDVRGTV